MSVIYDKSYDNRTKRPTPLHSWCSSCCCKSLVSLFVLSRWREDKNVINVRYLLRSGKVEKEIFFFFNSSTIVTFRVIFATPSYCYVLRCRPSGLQLFLLSVRSA